MPGMDPITARTTIVGLIGWPVGHSVSPRMHNAAFSALSLDWRYLPFPVDPDPDSRIGQAVLGLRALGLRGANVTVPHKQAVMPHLDRLTPAAQGIGAVNTILADDDGTLVGDNTDARGFIADLRDHDVDPLGVKALILGAGGSARAIAYGLAEAGATSVTVVNRTVSRAERLVQTMLDQFPSCTWRTGVSLENVGTCASGADLIVNCTSLGMEPDVTGMPWDENLPIRPNQTVYDLVYNPVQTRLIEHALDGGALAISGKGMLVWQGAFAFESWTGHPAPIDVMKDAAGIRQRT